MGKQRTGYLFRVRGQKVFFAKRYQRVRRTSSAYRADHATHFNPINVRVGV